MRDQGRKFKALLLGFINLPQYNTIQDTGHLQSIVSTQEQSNSKKKESILYNLNYDDAKSHCLL